MPKPAMTACAWPKPTWRSTMPANTMPKPGRRRRSSATASRSRNAPTLSAGVVGLGMMGSGIALSLDAAGLLGAAFDVQPAVFESHPQLADRARPSTAPRAPHVAVGFLAVPGRSPPHDGLVSPARATQMNRTAALLPYGESESEKFGIAATPAKLSSAKVDEVKNAAKSEAANLQRQGQNVIEDVQGQAGEIEQQLKDKIREKPLTAVASAIGIGRGRSPLITDRSEWHRPAAPIFTNPLAAARRHIVVRPFNPG